MGLFTSPSRRFYHYSDDDQIFVNGRLIGGRDQANSNPKPRQTLEREGLFSGSAAAIVVEVGAAEMHMQSSGLADQTWQLRVEHDEGSAPEIEERAEGLTINDDSSGSGGNNISISGRFGSVTVGNSYSVTGRTIINGRVIDSGSLGGSRAPSFDLALPTDFPLNLAYRQMAGEFTLDGTDLNFGLVKTKITSGFTVLDFSRGMIEELKLKNTSGNVKVKLPRLGGAKMKIELTSGNLVIEVPSGMGLTLDLSMLSGNRNGMGQMGLLEMGRHRWETANLAQAAARCELEIDLTSGNLSFERA
jgi:hypothetical protein